MFHYQTSVHGSLESCVFLKNIIKFQFFGLLDMIWVIQYTKYIITQIKIISSKFQSSCMRKLPTKSEVNQTGDLSTGFLCNT